MDKSFIGSGSQGNVVLAKLNGEVVCVKVFGNSRVLNQELSMLEAAQKSGVVPSIKGAHSSTKGHILAMSYHGGTTLESFLASRPSPSHVHKIMNSLNDAVRAIHSVGIIHNDLKENNILIERSHIKGRLVTVIDFGWSTFLGDVPYSHLNKSQMRGYPWLAPWLADGGNATVGSDLYSIGILYSTISEKYSCPIYKMLAQIFTNPVTKNEHNLTAIVSHPAQVKMSVSLEDIQPMLDESSCSACLKSKKPNHCISYLEQQPFCRPVRLTNFHQQYRQPLSQPFCPSIMKKLQPMDSFHWNESPRNSSSLAYQKRGNLTNVHQPSFRKRHPKIDLLLPLRNVPTNLLDDAHIHEFYPSSSNATVFKSQESHFSELMSNYSHYPEINRMISNCSSHYSK